MLLSDPLCGFTGCAVTALSCLQARRECQSGTRGAAMGTNSVTVENFPEGYAIATIAKEPVNSMVRTSE